jgi:mucin-19
MTMKKQILAFLLSLVAVVPALAQSHQPVGWSKGNDGRYQYLDFSENSLPEPSAATAAIPAAGQAVSITQEVVVDFQCLPNPGNPSSGNVRLYCDSGTGNLTCLTSTGASCLGGGGGGGATSVGLAGPTGIPISNSPVTTSGTLTWAMPTGWILGDLLVGNGANSVARLAAPTTPNSVPQVLMSTPSTGIGQIAAYALLGIAGRTVSGTTDTILATDRANTVEYTSSAAVAVTVPDPASSAGFNQSPAFVTLAEGAGPVTFTPQTSAVITYCTGAICLQNQPTVTLTQGEYATWSSPSTANWLVRVYATGAGSASPIFNNQLFSGGGVVLTGGLNLTVSAASYSIVATTYSSPQTNLTLSAADPTNPRIDVVAVNTSGAAVIITGTPAGSPVAPSVDPTSQLALTFLTIAANASAPTFSNILVYDENVGHPTEWDCTPSSNFNCNSTSNPYHSTHDIEATTAVATNNVALVWTSTLNLSTYSTFGFYIRNKANWPNAKSLSICFKNGSTVVGNCIGFKNGVYGFDQANVASYQQIVIPLTAFGLGSTVVDRVTFTVVGGSSSIGFYLDFMQLQSSTSGSGGGTPQFQLAVNGAGTAQSVNVTQGSNITLTPSTTGGVTTVTVAASSSSGLSGMTATQVPIAATATTVTSSKAIQGSDSNLLSSGTVSGTGASLCTDAQGGATTSGCSSGGITSVNAATGPAITVAAAGTSNVTTVGNVVTISSSGGGSSPGVNLRTNGNYTVQQGDNNGVIVMNGGGAGTVTIPQVNQVGSSPFVATHISSQSQTCTTCTTTTSFTQSAGETLLFPINWQGTQTITVAPHDLASDSFSLLQPCQLNYDTGDHESVCWYVAYNVASQVNNTISWTMSGSVQVNYLVDGYTTPAAIDQGGQNTFAATVFPSLVLSVSNSIELNLALVDGVASGSPCQTGWTQRNSVGGVMFLCERISSGVSSISFTSAVSNPSNKMALNMVNYSTTATTTFQAGWKTKITNISPYVETLTPTTSTINGQTTLLLSPNESCELISDGASPGNYQTNCSGNPNEVTNGLKGQPIAIAGVNLASQGADIGTTTLIATTAADAFYTVDADVNCDSSVSTGVATLTITFTDTSNTVQTYTTNAACTTLGSSSIGSIRQAFRAKNGTNIRYGVAHTGTQPTYDVSVAVNQLSTK